MKSLELWVKKYIFITQLEKHAIEILLDFKKLSEILLPKKTYFFKDFPPFSENPVRLLETETSVIRN